MRYYGFVILLGVFCLSSLLSARPSTEAPERQHFPANIQVELQELSPEIQAENALMVKFAMSCFVPDEFENYTDEEKSAFIEENFQSITEILKAYPDSSAALDALTNLLDHPQYHERLLAQLQELIDQGVQSSHLYFLYLIALDVCKQQQKFAEFIPTALEQFPDSSELILMGLKFYTKKDDCDKMNDMVDRAMKIPSLKNQPAIRIAALRRLVELGRKEEAKSLTAEIAQDELFLAHPQNNAIDVWDNLVKANAFQEIATLYTALLVNDCKYLDQDFAKDLFYRATLTACSAERYDIVTQLLDCLDENISDKQHKREILFDFGNILHDLSNEEEKNNSFSDKLLQLNIRVGREIRKNLPVMYVDDNTDRTIAKYLMMGCELQEALTVLKHIQKPNPMDQFLIATLQTELGQYQEALPTMRHLAKTQIKDLKAPFYMTLGALEDKCGNKQASDEALKQALKLDPKFGRAANYLGYSWTERGIQLNEAEKLIKIALEEDPDNSAYQDSMAWVKFKLGLSTEALRWMAKAFHELDLSCDYQTDKPTTEEMSEHIKEILHDLHCDYLADFY